MNSQIKQQWITALRSGEYTQGRWNLQSMEGFCCLGVLCDVYAKETNTEWKVKTADVDKTFTYYYFDDQSTHLPESVVKWAGLDHASPIIKFANANGNIKPLAVLNDEGSTFEEIAQLIEEQL